MLPPDSGISLGLDRADLMDAADGKRDPGLVPEMDPYQQVPGVQLRYQVS